MKIRHILPTLACAVSLTAHGMDSVPVPAPPTGDSRIIRVQVEYVEMSHEALTQLLFLAEPKTTDATGLRKQVQEMVVKKEAKILETQMTSGASGQKVTSESVSELIYPTEYEPPELPCSVPSTTGASSPAQEVNAPSVATPTAFDTRNCGSTLETESTLSADGKSVALRLVPELVWHTGDTTWMDLKDAIGNVSEIKMPNFYTLRFQTALSCPDGRYLLASVLSPKDGKGIPDMSRKVMVFVKCDLLAGE